VLILQFDLSPNCSDTVNAAINRDPELIRVSFDYHNYVIGIFLMQASSRRRSKASKSRATCSSDEELSRVVTEHSRKNSSDSVVRTSSNKSSSRHLMTSSDSDSSSSSTNDESSSKRHRTPGKPPPATAAPKSRLITSSSDSDDSSDDVDSVTLLKNRVLPDKSQKTPSTSTALPPRQAIYTSSDNDDDSDCDSLSSTPLKKAKPSSVSTPPSSKLPPKKPSQSSAKKVSVSSSGTNKTISKPYPQGESSTDSEVAAAVKSSKSAVKDMKKGGKERESQADSAVAKDAKKLPKSSSDKPVTHLHISSAFGDALAKSSAHAKVSSKSAATAKDDKVGRKDSRISDTHKSSSSVSAVSAVPDRSKVRSFTDPVKSKHSESSDRHALKTSSGMLSDKKGGLERTPKSTYETLRENVGRKMSDAETSKAKKGSCEGGSADSYGMLDAECDELPLIRPGNIFEKMGKQDAGSADKTEEVGTRLFGRDSAAVTHCRASEIAVFMPESDDDDREPVVEPGKLSIERLKEDSAKEETIEEAVKAIIEFTKEPSSPLRSSSKATDSEALEDTSGEAVDDDLGLSDDVGELNAAIGNLIEKELEPVGGDSQDNGEGNGSGSETGLTSPTHFQSSALGGLSELKSEASQFVGTSSSTVSLKDDHSAVKVEVDSVSRHIRTSVHDEQNVTSFMSRLEKATADVVDFAAISAAAASQKLPEKVSSETIATSKAEVSSRLFATAVISTTVKTEDEKPSTVMEEQSSLMETGKSEPPEFPMSTRTVATKQVEMHGASSVERTSNVLGAEPASCEDSSAMTDLYEFKDDDDDDTATTRQKDFVLHKRSRKRHADSECDAIASATEVVVDAKKLRHSGFHQSEPVSECVTITNSETVSTSWRTNMDLVIDAVARGEFERGDDFNYYTSQTSSTTKGRRGRGPSRDDTSQKAGPASAAGCQSSAMPMDGFNAVATFQRPVSAVSAGAPAALMAAAAAAGQCSPKLLLQAGMHRICPPVSLSASCEYPIPDFCLC